MGGERSAGGAGGWNNRGLFWSSDAWMASLSEGLTLGVRVSISKIGVFGIHFQSSSGFAQGEFADSSANPGQYKDCLVTIMEL